MALDLLERDSRGLLYWGSWEVETCGEEEEEEEEMVRVYKITLEQSFGQGYCSFGGHRGFSAHRV